MRNSILLAIAVSVGFCASARADVRVAWERNEADAATRDFRFKSVPPPSADDAANEAKVAILEGRGDVNGRGVTALRDGRLPANADDPGESFFFAPRTDGGRILIDLGSARRVTRVNTYSWHAGPRGPQVYKLYAADGAAEGFRAKPANGADPVKAGWTLLASVDTRPKTHSPGGQYGVSVHDPNAGSLGSVRYLLLDVSRTGAHAMFDNTFFSEIDVCDGRKHAPATMPAGRTVAKAGEAEILFDYAEVPELKEWVESSLAPVCTAWYPRIVKMLPGEGYTAPRRLSVTFRRDMRGVAATGGTRVYCAAAWFKRNLEGEAIGAVVHELVHVVQQYRRVRGGRPNPGWMVEGIADYIRWFLYEPKSKRPRPNPARAKYTDSYRTTAAFLNYVTETHDKEIVRKLNDAMRRGRYTPDLWKQYTGKTAEALWTDYVKTLVAPARGKGSTPSSQAGDGEAVGTVSA